MGSAGNHPYGRRTPAVQQRHRPSGRAVVEERRAVTDASVQRLDPDILVEDGALRSWVTNTCNLLGQCGRECTYLPKHVSLIGQEHEEIRAREFDDASRGDGSK